MEGPRAAVDVITLTYNMAIVNSILQHPDIWKDIAPEGVVPFDICAVPGVVHFLVNDGNGVISFQQFRDGVKIHPNIVPSKRGKRAYAAIEESIQLAFESGCPCIYAEIEPRLKHVSMLARKLGFNLLESGERDLFIKRKLDS